MRKIAAVIAVFALILVACGADTLTDEATAPEPEFVGSVGTLEDVRIPPVHEPALPEETYWRTYALERFMAGASILVELERELSDPEIGTAWNLYASRWYYSAAAASDFFSQTAATLELRTHWYEVRDMLLRFSSEADEVEHFIAAGQPSSARWQVVGILEDPEFQALYLLALREVEIPEEVPSGGSEETTPTPKSPNGVSRRVLIPT